MAAWPINWNFKKWCKFPPSTVCALAKPGFCSGARISCKPKNGALLSTRTQKNDDSKILKYCALLGTRANNNIDNQSAGAGMDILALLLAVIILAFIIQLFTSVTMIASMVLIIII